MAHQSYSVSLTCEKCAATGQGSASDNDNGPYFSIDTVPESFRHEGHSPNPLNQQFSHQCGGSATYTLSRTY